MIKKVEHIGIAVADAHKANLVFEKLLDGLIYNAAELGHFFVDFKTCFKDGRLKCIYFNGR